MPSGCLGGETGRNRISHRQKPTSFLLLEVVACRIYTASPINRTQVLQVHRVEILADLDRIRLNTRRLISGGRVCLQWTILVTVLLADLPTSCWLMVVMIMGIIVRPLDSDPIIALMSGVL